jgi:hypothetical protein
MHRIRKHVEKIDWRYVIGGAIPLALVVFALLTFMGSGKGVVPSFKAQPYVSGVEADRYAKKIDKVHPSRTWMNFMMDDIRDNEKNPPEAARAYAYVASVFDDVRTATGSDTEANRATRAMLIEMYPYLSVDSNRFLNIIQGDTDVTLSKQSLAILQKYVDRWRAEPHGHKDVAIPKDPTLWKPVNERGAKVEPIATEASGFARWVVTQDFHLDPPPVVGSAQDKKEIQIMKEAITHAPEWKERIHKWALAKGTGTPAWLWQEKLYEYGKDLDDVTYGHLQKQVAQDVADVFVVCWGKKYVYWTARPFMRIPGFKPVIETPFFPGYPSGHSTVSAAAATVLGQIFPSHKKDLLDLAIEAKDSRLYSGIHFSADNEKGFELGVRVGNAEIEAQQLKSVEQ